MDWNIFWTIIFQVSIAVVAFAVLAVPVSLGIYIIRYFSGISTAKAPTDHIIM